jgi:hypothetical protein
LFFGEANRTGSAAWLEGGKFLKSKQRKRWPFRLIEIGAFDARRGCRRCSVPGTVITLPPPAWAPWVGDTKLCSDFWRDRSGNVVVRFSSTHGYAFHYRATLVSGDVIPEQRMEEFERYAEAVLVDWEGTDDQPDEDPRC